MASKAIAADLLAIENPRDHSLYIHLRLSIDMNDSLRRLIKRKAATQAANFQIDSQTLGLNQIIVKVRPPFSFEDASDQVIAALKRWHEIECGWLSCLPHMRITRVIEGNRLQTELFYPKESSVGVQLGRTIAQKQWAMIKGNWLLVSMTAKEEFQLRRQLT
ncbi:MAG TPA: hypothetical protein VF281_04715 [Candidatus Saccharimonadales bacterium]